MYLPEWLGSFPANLDTQKSDELDSLRVKESSDVQLKNLLLNRGGGLRHNLSPIVYAALSSIPRKFKTTPHVHQRAHN